VVGGGRFIIESCIDLPLEQIESVWQSSLTKIMS